MAVIGMRCSRASQTCGSLSHWVGIASRGRSMLGDQLHDLGLARSLLGLLEGFDELRQFAGGGILRHTVFAAEPCASPSRSPRPSAPDRIQRKTASCSADGAFG